MSDCVRCNRSSYFCAEHVDEMLRKKDATIADREARLKAIRGHLAHSFSESEESDAAYRATDLRVKNWRKQ